MLRDKRGQGALEYMAAYGWAFVIVLGVGVGLWILGIFDLGQDVTVQSGFSKIKPLEASIVMTPEGNFSGIFLNSAGNKVRIFGFEIFNLLESTPKGCAVINGTNIKVEGGKQFSVKANGCVDSIKTLGEPYILTINISYTERVGAMTISHSESGTVHGVYELEPTTPSTSTTMVSTTSTTAPASSSTSTTSPGSTTTSTSLTSTSTTSSSSSTIGGSTSSTTTTVAASGVGICSDTYVCGDSDSVCPQNFGVSCAAPDPDC